jgi:hypothetical protein
MSKEIINITPEAIQEAYKTLGVELSKSEESVIEKAEDTEEEEVEKESEEEVEEKKEKKEKKPKMEKAEESSFEKAFAKLNDGLNKKFDALITLNKGLENQLSETREELSKSQERIEELETSTAGRKSISTQNYIEKAFQENETNGKKMLSISKHKANIQNMLIEKAGFGTEEVIEKSQVDNFWRNEMEYFEATGSLTKRAIEKLYTEDNIQLVK